MFVIIFFIRLRKQPIKGNNKSSSLKRFSSVFIFFKEKLSLFVRKKKQQWANEQKAAICYFKQTPANYNKMLPDLRWTFFLKCNVNTVVRYVQTEKKSCHSFSDTPVPYAGHPAHILPRCCFWLLRVVTENIHIFPATRWQSAGGLGKSASCQSRAPAGPRPPDHPRRLHLQEYVDCVCRGLTDAPAARCVYPENNPLHPPPRPTEVWSTSTESRAG